ncbi:MAG TPA: hypothetical protein VIV12_23455 [Streptosporangiaceae bacterium]
MVVIEEDDSAGAKQPPEVDEVEENGVKAVVAVDEGKIELTTLAEQAGERSLRFLVVVRHHVGDTGLIEKLQPAVSKTCFLHRVDDDMTGAGSPPASSPSQAADPRPPAGLAEPDQPRTGGLPAGSPGPASGGRHPRRRGRHPN